MKFKLWHMLLWMGIIGIGALSLIASGDFEEIDYLYLNIWMLIPLVLYLYSNYRESKKEQIKLLK